MDNAAFNSMKWCEEASAFFSVVGTEMFTSSQLHIIGLVGKDASSFIQILKTRGAIEHCSKIKIKNTGKPNLVKNQWRFTREYKLWYERTCQNIERVVVRKKW